MATPPVVLPVNLISADDSPGVQQIQLSYKTKEMQMQLYRALAHRNNAPFLATFQILRNIPVI